MPYSKRIRSLWFRIEGYMGERLFEFILAFFGSESGF